MVNCGYAFDVVNPSAFKISHASTPNASVLTSGIPVPFGM